ncbi:cytochrome b/b6 domain-containing protein [Pseudarthrobacter sp. IC2-21]|uniref:cytochrome b/b6 domain-containing protein n=1 Tax=Pseudarthrobacter sp. IC2-21 TaxID=3092262 RepID=UPI0039BD3DEB
MLWPVKKDTQMTKSKWFPLVWIIPAAVLTLAALVLVARLVRDFPAVQDFLRTYPGETPLPAGSPVGIPAWLNWQHFLNAFFLVLIIKSGWRVRTVTRPPAYWTRNNKGFIRTKNPPTKISLDLWLHLTVDILWLLNGLVFSVLLAVSGHWVRLVPTSWEAFPNALSAALQYLSLDWPTENGWVNYNSLQMLAYFTIVFLAAPLAALTGVRMSPLWPKSTEKLNRAYPIELARAVHLPVMFFFVGFVIVHVALVLTTGALRNLNHMYAAESSASSWLGFWLFAASVVIMAIAWVGSRPLILRPIANLTGKVSR